MIFNSQHTLFFLVILLALGGCDSPPTEARDGGTVDAEPPAFIPSEPEPFAGLDDDLEIRIDTLGMPHVYGSSDRDTYFGGGYVSARNRLFQMEMLRLRAHGHWSSVAGPDRYEDDRLSVPIPNSGQRTPRPDRGGEAWGLLVAWTAGINRFIEGRAVSRTRHPEGYDMLPLWTPEDVVIVSRMAFGDKHPKRSPTSIVARYFPTRGTLSILSGQCIKTQLFRNPASAPTGLAPTRHETPSGLEDLSIQRSSSTPSANCAGSSIH